jgi:PAS domain S-box-containing protein
MKEYTYKNILEFEKKISILENKVEFLESIIDTIKLNNNSIQENNLLNYKINPIYNNSEEIHENHTNSLKTSIFLKTLIESIPFPVFIKDENSTYLHVNSHESKLFGLPEIDIIGKQDAFFISDEDELLLIKETDEDVLKNNKAIELPSQKFTLPNGKSFAFKTHKIPFMNPITGKTNILGFSMDATDSMQLSHLKKIVLLCSNPYL